MVISAPTTGVSSPLVQQLFSRRDHIPPRHNVMLRIERGIVRTVTANEHGTLIGLGYWGPGDIVGYCFSRLDPYRIECRTSVEVSILPSELWHQALDVDAIVLHIQQAEELLHIVHIQPLPPSLSLDKSGQPSFGLSVGVTSGLVNGCPLLSSVIGTQSVSML